MFCDNRQLFISSVKEEILEKLVKNRGKFMEPAFILFKSVSVERLAVFQRLFFFPLMFFVAVFFACSNRNILSKLEK